MRIARKGVSPVVATLLLILIAVAAAVLLYTWVSGLSANVAGSKVTGKTLSLIQATWAFPDSNTYNNDWAFDNNKAVLILSFQAPAAAVQGSSALTLDVVDVLYNGRVLCHYANFAMSSDDDYHVGKTIGGNTAAGLAFFGYAGSTAGDYDANDLMVPGGIIGAYTTNASPAAGGQATYGNALPTGYTPAVITATTPFATVVAGTWEVTYVSTNYVETNFAQTGAVIRYDRFANAFVNNTAVGAGTTAIPLYDKVTVSQNNFAVVIWCPNVNPTVMGQVNVKLYFPDGSSWQTTVPLTIQ